MKETRTSTMQGPTVKPPGLTNDFTAQEAEMTSSAMPPAFALTAGEAGNNPGTAKAAGEKPAMKATIHVDGVPPELVQKLAEFEGIEYAVYDDGFGNLTGGLGHLLLQSELAEFPKGTVLSQAQIEAWAKVDIGGAWKAGQEQAGMLGVNSHDFKVALASMSFQNGVYWYTIHKNTWALMQAHKWDEAATEAEDSEWARQTPTRLLDFQAALRKLSEGQGGNIADPFRKKAAEAKKVAAKKQSSPKQEAVVDGDAGKGGDVKAMPQGKEGIRQVQTKLKGLGFYEGEIDGVEFRRDKQESGTTKGIKAFQESRGLPETGTVDAATWGALNGVKDDLMVWDKFMEGLGLPNEKGGKSETSKGWGSEPGLEKEKAGGENGLTMDWWKDLGWTSGAEIAETGDFVDKQYWRTQQTAAEGGQAGFVSPSASPTACRYVSSEMLILFMKAEKPEVLAALGVSGIGDLAFGSTKDVTENAADAGGFLRILQEDASQHTGGSEKNVQNPDAMVVNEQASDAIAYIDEKLSAGIPLVVGVDHTFNKGRNEGTTDHFVTLTGMGKTEDGKKFYHFFDPGRSNQVNGVDNSGKNRLVEEFSGVYRAPEPTGSGDAQRYYLTTVIVFPADRKKFKKENQ